MPDNPGRMRPRKIHLVWDARLGARARDQVDAVIRNVGAVAVPSAAEAELIVACLGAPSDASVAQDLRTRVKPVIAFCQKGSDQSGLLGDTFADTAQLPGVMRSFLESYLRELHRSAPLDSDADQAPGRVEPVVIFLSSPKDVEPYHDDVREVVRRWNQRMLDGAEAFLSLAIGEDAASEIWASGSPQRIINERLPVADADIVLGMMWHRCGTPTETAESGTIEEIRKALECREETGLPWVGFYRCDAPVNPHDIDHKQHARVREFVAELETRGVVKPFVSGEQLQHVITADLETIVPRVLHLKRKKGVRP